MMLKGSWELLMVSCKLIKKSPYLFSDLFIKLLPKQIFYKIYFFDNITNMFYHD